MGAVHISLEWHLNVGNPKQDAADTIVASDASSNWEAGALCLPSWFYFEWSQTLRASSIQVKELVPVVVAAALFGRYWKGKLVAFSVDNQAVVEIINKSHSKESH